MEPLISFWIEFDDWPESVRFRRIPTYPREAGVTAADEHGALDLVRRGFYADDRELPPVRAITRDVPAAPKSSPDEVLRRGVPSGALGIWYPSPFFPDRTIVDPGVPRVPLAPSPLTMDSLVDMVGRDAFEAIAAGARSTGYEAFESELPHDLAGRLWYEGDEPLRQRLAVAIELFERMPCYGNLMYWTHWYREFDAPTREAMWASLRRFLEDPNASVVGAACYSLWVDWFEDPNTVGDAWRAMTQPIEPLRPRLEHLLPITGPVPWALKAPLYERLAAAGGWDDLLVQALYFSAGDAYGMIDRTDAQTLLKRLAPTAEARRKHELGRVLAGGGSNLRERLVDTHRDGHG